MKRIRALLKIIIIKMFRKQISIFSEHTYILNARQVQKHAMVSENFTCCKKDICP